MKVLLLLSFLTIALLFTGCEGANHLISAGEAEPKAPAVSENANPSSDVDIQKLQRDLIELESRLTALEEVITGTDYQNPWKVPASLEDRVASLEQLVKSKPWELEVRKWYPSPSIEDRVSQIERQLGIGSSERLWNP